jgi:GNAT superfamily N-acetyltransferase
MTLTLQRFDAEQVQTAIGEFAQLLCDIVDAGASVGFLAPLPEDDARRFWYRIAGDISTGSRVLIAALDDGRIIGTAQLVLAPQPNAPHRAEVQKVLVHPAHRRQGIGKLLMAAIESEARSLNRTLLVLDTVKGNVAERLYEQAGYTRVGVIANFALSTTGQPEDAVFFYRQL